MCSSGKKLTFVIFLYKGILTALRAQGKSPKELPKQRIVCLGAGSAGLGVINSLIDGMVEEGLPREVANKNVWLVDKNGLLTTSRGDINNAQKPYARSDMPNDLSFQEIVEQASFFFFVAIFTHTYHHDQPSYCFVCLKTTGEAYNPVGSFHDGWQLHWGDRPLDGIIQRTSHHLSSFKPNWPRRVHGRAGLHVEWWPCYIR